ncbi:MAG: response regulator [Anaerolineae bacterium]|nr:response regulator [Anaerolineae bacterium]
MTLILVAEDDPSMREGICDTLELEGYAVCAAANGREALGVMQETVPDLIISDIMMPEMDGYRFYEAVRQHEAWLAIPFIFLTAKDQREDIRLGRRLGADDYLTKPFDSEDLLIAVQSKLRRADQFQQGMRERVEQLEEQLVRTERLATIGQLAAEFAHEIKNPLTAISMYAEFAQRDLNNIDSALAQDMEQIVHQSERIARLAKSLLTFSRQTPQLLEGVNLSRLFDRVLETIQFRLTDITVEKQYDPDLPLIRADAGQIEQVLMNLIVNAIQAMPEGGQLTLQTARIPDAQKPLVSATVIDTGCGIPPEHITQLFQPYFTTKKAGEGTGLGLYVCKNIVEQHHGTVEVSSQVNVGTTFTLTLPLKQPDSEIKV